MAGACLPAGADGGADAATDASGDHAVADSGACFVRKDCPSGSWHPIAPSPLEGRARFGFAWTGAELFIVGGRSNDFTYRDGARYDPASDQWTALPLLPEALGVRYDTPLVFTGSSVALWSGGQPVTSSKDGAVFDLSQQSWSTITSVGAPTGRINHALAYDAVSDELLVWGGFPVSDGARFSLSTQTWTSLPDAPLSDREQSAFAWDPARRWLYVFGGTYFDDGAILDAANGTWKSLPPVPAGVEGRRLAPAVIAQGKFVVWGGDTTTGVLADGLIYDPDQDSWTKMAASSLEGRASHLAVTDGEKIFYFGGIGVTSLFADGAVYDVAQDSWSKPTQAPLSGREQLGGAWTPHGIVVWGGPDADGAMYVP